MTKNGLFPNFFFRQYRPRKCLFRYSRTKNPFLGYKNQKFKKSKNWHSSKGINPWFWSKNGHFSDFFSASIGQENVFYDILEQKNAFLGFKTRSSKSRKIDIFPWNWSMELVQKWTFFQLFYLVNIEKENVFYIILESKNVLLGYKSKKFKKLKNWHF